MNSPPPPLPPPNKKQKKRKLGQWSGHQSWRTGDFVRVFSRITSLNLLQGSRFTIIFCNRDDAPTFGLLSRWLDKLGLAAKYGYKVLLRQALFYGNYSLIGEDLEPNPVS